MIKILYDGRLGVYEFPRAARCPKCRTRVSSKDAEPHPTQQPAITCPKCKWRWIIPFAHAAMIQQLDAGHDTNGNPLRCWLIYEDDGSVGAVINEGYEGKPRIYGDHVVELPKMFVRATEYREWIKTGEEIAGYREVKA